MRNIAISIMSAMALTLGAQQEVMVSQYMFNGLFVNPGYAGSHEYVSSSLLHRTQWVDFPGAPKTALFAIDGPVRYTNIGLGLLVVNDRIGATEQTDIYGNYAYQLRLGEGKLAFGLRAGATNYIFNNDKLTVWDESDVVFAGVKSAWLPKAGFGAYYFSEFWYAGLSIPNLIAYDPKNTFNLDVNQATFLRRHYNFNAGYVFILNDQVKLKPSALLKYEPSAPLQLDINVNLLFIDQFWIGGSYRTGDAITAMIEYQTLKRFRVGYAYDFTTSKIRNYSTGTHEIMIGYDIGKDPIKIKTPRYF